MELRKLQVIVVGGAMGGAATALLLARAGASVTLLEKVAHPRAVGAGIAIAANGMAVLESLGLGPALAPYGRPVSAGRIVDATGRVLFAPGGPEVVMFRRSTLHGVLLDALAAEPGIALHFGAEVVEASRDGEVTARTQKGDLCLLGDLIVGADGVHSRIRSAGSFGAQVSPPGIPYLRALVDGELGREEEAWTEAGLFGSFNVDGGTYLYASASSPDCRRALEAKDLESLRNAWSRAYAPAASLLSRIGSWEDVLVNHVLRVDCERWYDGRLLLLGDAAHAMPPNLGQGANSALVDAAVLLDELRRADDISTALAAYQRRRRPAVQRVADTAGRLGALAEKTRPITRWLRDRVLMPLAGRLSAERSVALMLQEEPARLAAIGRA